MSNSIDDSELVFYCHKCLAIDVRTEGKITYCPHCFSRRIPSTIDVTTWERWEELYEEKYGHPLVQRKSIYDDLKDTYDEDATESLTATEAIENQMIVRQKINLNIDKLKE